MTTDLKLPRILTQNRAYSLCVIFSLGVGISSAAGVFAVVESLRHGQLPFPNADRILHLYISGKLNPNDRAWELSPEVARLLETTSSPLEATALYQFGSMSIRGLDRSTSIWGAYVSPNFARLLGARMHLGRPIDSTAASTPAAMLSYRHWSTRLGSDSTIVGRAIVIDGTSHIVTGVTAREWEFPDRVPIWVSPLPKQATRHERLVQILGLLKPGIRDDQGRAMIATVASGSLTVRPREGDRIGSMSLRDYLLQSRLKIAIIFLTIIAIFVAFITAVNFAGLVLARGIRRRGEIGVRAALGASVWRLARHLIAESLLLCALGGALAAILAPSVVKILATGFADAFPPWLEVTLGWRTVALSIALSVIFGILFGLGPALDLARPALTTFLRSAGSTASSGAALVRARATLVSLQVALATGVLVLLGAMLGGSFGLTRPDLGYDPDPIITGYVSSDAGKPEQLSSLLWNARKTPGVAAAALIHTRYLDRYTFTAESDQTFPFAYLWWAQVSDSFFTVLRPRVIAGRLPTDEEERIAAPVAVVSRVVAKRMFANEALGKSMRVDGMRMTIIGVVDDVNRYGFQPEPTPGVFTVFAPGATTIPHSELWVRSQSAALVTPPLRDLQLRASNNALGVPVWEVRSLAADLRAQAQRLRAVARIILGIFGVALGLAALGIYGLVAYTAEMRSREMAIREALGASRVHVAGLVLRSATLQSLAGTLGGAVLATIGATLMRSHDLVIKSAVPTTAVSLIVIALTVLISSVGPLRESWRRDLSYVLRV